MKTMLFAAVAALSLGMGSAAFAESEGGAQAITRFTEIPGVVAHAPAQSTMAAQNGQTVQTFVTQSSRGTYLFAPNDGGGANS